ncbi:MAG: hypothetical protein IIA72_10805 [Proteobacteria bacterium]|nr:hypothetical protein [Pseudomonadota bacterium]
MARLPTPNEIPVAGTNGDGLDFVLWTATPSEGQDDDDIHIRRNQT